MDVRFEQISQGGLRQRALLLVVPMNGEDPDSLGEACPLPGVPGKSGSKFGIGVQIRTGFLLPYIFLSPVPGLGKVHRWPGVGVLVRKRKLAGGSRTEISPCASLDITLILSSTSAVLRAISNSSGITQAG